MFSNSIALVSTNDRDWFSRMRVLMRQAGLKETRPFPKSRESLTQFRNGPLPFVFVDASLSADEVREVFAAVRTHAELPVRFLPIIVLSRSREAQIILHHIELGCDDIVTMPLTAAALLERLKRQVAGVRDYFQTESYFGPDRRRHELGRTGTREDRGSGDHPFRHFTIERSAQHGISVIGSQMHRPSTEQIVLPV